MKELIAELEKRFGEGIVFRMIEEGRREVPVVSSGLPNLDEALGIGGIPRTGITELFADFGVGKTTLTLSFVREAQAQGLEVLYIDSEQSFSPDYAEACGVDLDKLLLSQTTCTEEVFELIHSCVPKFGLIVLDSLASLAPKTELEGEIGIAPVGLQARLVANACRTLGGALNRYKSALLVTNQLRMKIQAWGNPWTTPGGQALKHFALIRIELKKRQAIKRNGATVGQLVEAEIKKNKLAVPFKKAALHLVYGKGFLRTASLAELAIEKGVIEKRGSYFYFQGSLLAQGLEKLWEALDEERIFGEILSGCQAGRSEEAG